MMEGWDGLRFADNEQVKQSQDKQFDIDICFVRCFSTNEGQKVLEYLEQVTLEQPAWYPGEDPSHGYAREGQNSIVREIKRRIDRGRSV